MKNFILTDIMKTGHHWWYGQFIKYNTIKDQHIEVCDDYYHLNQFKLTEFDRRIALICIMHDHLLKNDEYKSDLLRRIEKLKEQKFEFILATPWESRENTKNNDHKNFFLNLTQNIWYGEQNWFWFLMHEKNYKKNFLFNHASKKYDFLYLNKYPRGHRKELYNKIIERNLLENSLYSFLGLNHPKKLLAEYELPWVDQNNYPILHHDQDIYEKPYNDTVCNIVSESNDSNDEVFITEKIWKPIIAEQLFVVHGNFGYLKKLKEMGFKTFHNFFDESYDEEQNKKLRIDKIVNTLNNIKSTDRIKLYEQTAEIRKHNRDFFWSRKELGTSINQTILNFFKIYDKK